MIQSGMNIKALEALRAFMECGSMTAAAERLHCTQPQVSRLIAALEEEAGFPLFIRRNRRLTPAPAAREFYAQVERTLASIESLRSQAARIREQQNAHVRILTAPHVTDSMIADAVASIAREIPGFTASVDSRARIDIEMWVGRELFDLGITVLPMENPAFETEGLVTANAVAVMAEGHPLAARPTVTLEDLLTTTLIATSSRSVLRQRLDQAFREIGRLPDIRFETPNGLIACQLAARGIGVCVADAFIAHSSLRPGVVIRPFLPQIDMRYVFLFPTGQPRSPVVRRLADEIRVRALGRLKEFGSASDRDQDRSVRVRSPVLSERSKARATAPRPMPRSRKV